MTTSSASTPDADRVLLDALHRVWGFSDFRPLQRDAMHAILDARDSVVVLPTGGGKSLCFQAPAIVPRQYVSTQSPQSTRFDFAHRTQPALSDSRRASSAFDG